MEYEQYQMPPGLSQEQLDDLAAELWSRYARDNRLDAHVTDMGKPRLATSAGTDPLVTGLVVALTPVAVEIARDFWRRILLPAIEAKLGTKLLRTDETQPPDGHP